MKLYLIERTDDVSWDEHIAVVIREELSVVLRALYLRSKDESPEGAAAKDLYNTLNPALRNG